MKEVGGIDVEEVGGNWEMGSCEWGDSERYYGDYEKGVEEKRVWNVCGEGKEGKVEGRDYDYGDEW